MCHQPWQCFYLLRRKEEMKEKQVLDTDNMTPDNNSDKGESSKPKTKPNEYGDNQYFGPWITYKTTHAIMINGTTKGDSVPQMMETLQMVKPFEITPVP